VHEVTGDLTGGAAAGEHAVDTEVGRHRLVEPGAADHQQRPALSGEGLSEGSRHLPDVEQVCVTLGDHLRDEHGVGLLLDGVGHEVRHRDLRAEVHHLQLAVVLQTLLPGESLDVEDRVDADGVGVGPDAAAHHDQPTVQGRLHEAVDLLRRQQGIVALDDLDRRGIDQVVHPAVDDEEGEVRPHRPGMHDQRRIESHLPRELRRRPLGQLGVGHRQGEGHLDHPVTGRVAVRAEQALLLGRPGG
jgi:hypothetical protein